MDDAAVPLGGTKQRALLAYLVLRRGEAVGTERLVDELWGGSPPADGRQRASTLYVSRLRRALGDEVRRHTGLTGMQSRPSE